MIVQIASLLLAQAATAQAATPPPGCTGEEHAALDFWVGEWDVYPNGRDTLVAHSRIEKLYNGCAIRENWMPLRGAGGGSLTGWWQGSGPNGEDGLTRMTYSVAEDGAVRQFGEFSADHGLTWQPNFDFIYRRTAPAGD